MFNINTQKAFKISLIVYAAVILIGLIFTVVLGPKLDINFSGGTRLSYSYKGEVKEADFEAATKEILGKKSFKVSKNEAVSRETKIFSISLAGREALSSAKQDAILAKLQETFAKNSFDIYASNAVNASIAGTFFAKSLVAMLITALLVICYVGFRFRKIGGVTAAITALCSLALDLIVAFFICVIFRLEIDSNFMAVVLTILGYSLNDTIVIYDRVRENKKLYPNLSLNENMDNSVSATMKRNIVTTATTLLAILTVIVVSEIFGLTTLRTFAIPMAFGLVSGCISSLFVAGPLWVIWRNKLDAHKAKKAA